MQIGLRPTGWTYKPTGNEDKNPTVPKIIANAQRRDYSPAFLMPQRDSTDRCQAYGVPYSEHSSMFELVRALGRPGQCAIASLTPTRPASACPRTGSASSRPSTCTTSRRGTR